MSKTNRNNITVDKIHQSNREFWIGIMLLLISSAVYGMFIFLEKIVKCIEWSQAELSNAVGVICQIVSTIVTCVISIQGIAFSLQSNLYYGVSLHMFYAMRRKPHFSFRTSTIISFVLLAQSMIGYLIGSLSSCVCASVSSVIFCIYLVCTESPYLAGQDETIFKIIQDRMILEYQNRTSANDTQLTEFTDILRELIQSKNMVELYHRLSIPETNDYNKYVLQRLLEEQVYVAFHLNKIDSNSKLIAVTDGLLDSTKLMLNGEFNISSILGENIQEYFHQLTRVLFCLLEIPVSHDKTVEAVAEHTTYCSLLTPNSQAIKDLNFSVLTVIIVDQIKENRFEIIDSIKRKLSISPFVLSFPPSSVTVRVFGYISFIMYALYAESNLVPEDVKTSIMTVVDSSYIANRVEVLSWKSLFKEFSQSMMLTWDDFLTDLNLAKNYSEYYIENQFAQVATLSYELALEWYLAYCFSCDQRLTVQDYDKLFHASDDQRMIGSLKQIENSCYSNSDRQFAPSERLNRMANFYDDNAPLWLFTHYENDVHAFRNYVDLLRKNEIEQSIEASKEFTNCSIEQHIQPLLDKKVQAIFGFCSSIDISKEEKRYFAIVAPKDTHAIINFDEFICNTAITSLLRIIRNNVIDKYKRTIIVRKAFDDSVRELVNNDFEFVTGHVKYCKSAISDPTIQEMFDRKVNGAQIIDTPTYLFTDPTIILKGGYSMNCHLQLAVLDLTPEQISKQVDEYIQSDGQYVYDGALVTREELSRIIRDTKVVYQIIFCYKVLTYKDGIVSLDIHST